MNVYIVIENYTFDYFHDTRVSVYKDKEDAMKAFNMIVNREKKDSWIATKSNVVINDEDNIEDNAFNAYVEDNAEEFETYIVVQEKEVW
jgi:hypothetical protein